MTGKRHARSLAAWQSCQIAREYLAKVSHALDAAEELCSELWEMEGASSKHAPPTDRVLGKFEWGVDKRCGNCRNTDQSGDRLICRRFAQPVSDIEHCAWWVDCNA